MIGNPELDVREHAGERGDDRREIAGVELVQREPLCEEATRRQMREAEPVELA